METAATSLTSGDIIKLVLSTGIFTALINQGITWLKDWRKDKEINERMAQYSALRIAIDLEAFAISCAKAISDSNFFSQTDGHAGSQHSKIPSLLEYPKDIDWRLIERSLCERTLALRNEIELCQGEIDFWYEIDYECIPSACCEQTGTCGYRAWKLANDLRKFYKLSSFDPRQISWDIEAILKDIHDKALAKQKCD